MTFYLQGVAEPPKIKANQPDLDIPSFFGGLSAAFSRSQLENNANFRSQREELTVQGERVSDYIDRIGPENVWTKLRERGLAPDVEYNDFANGLMRENLNYRPAIEEMAAIAQSENPDAWADVDLSPEGLDLEVNSRLQAEYDRLTLAIEMMPAGQGMTNLLGGMAGISADIKNLPFLLMGGGGGSILRVMGREAMINMAAEAAFLPDQYKMADRLDIEDPDVVKQLAMAGVFGAGFGAFAEGFSRAVSYRNIRNSNAPKLDGMDDMSTEEIISAVEDILQTSDDPMPSVLKLTDEMRADLPGVDDFDLGQLTDEEISGLSSPERRQLDYEIEIGNAEATISELDARMDYKYPLAEIVKKHGGVRYKMLDKATGEMVLTPIAEELAAMGVTPKTHPFIWRKEGHTDLDNLVADEFERLSEVIDVDPATGYFDKESITRALGEELSTGNKTALSGEIQGLQRRIDELRVAPEPETGIPATEPRFFEEGFSIDPSEYSDESAIEADVFSWMRQNGYDSLVTAEEMDALVSQMKDQGGSLDDFMDRMVDDVLDRVDAETRSQEAQYAEIPIQDPVSVRSDVGEAPEAMGQGGSTSAGPLSQRGEPTGSGPSARDAQGPLFEATDAGQQSLIDGVKPLTTQDRIMAARAAPMRGGDEPTDFGLFDVGGRSQRDMFSDPVSAEAKVIHDTINTDLRTAVEADDFEIDMGDGKGPRKASTVLDEIDDAQEWADVLQLCGRPMQ